MYADCGVKGKASPTSLSAALALAVKMTVDPGGALKKDSTAARALAVSAPDSFELNSNDNNKVSDGRSQPRTTTRTLRFPSGCCQAQ